MERSQARKNGVMVSHHMFVDDLLIFGEETKAQLLCVMETIENFCNMSGEEINYEKTIIMFSNNVNRSMQNKLHQISKFRCTTSFGRYLGVPLNGKKLRKYEFQYLVDQVAVKLNGWKRNNLALASRTTVAKSVIEAIPLYILMIAKIPKNCNNVLNGMQRKFVWGDTDETRKIRVVA